MYILMSNQLAQCLAQLNPVETSLVRFPLFPNLTNYIYTKIMRKSWLNNWLIMRSMAWSFWHMQKKWSDIEIKTRRKINLNMTNWKLDFKGKVYAMTNLEFNFRVIANLHAFTDNSYIISILVNNCHIICSSESSKFKLLACTLSK